MNMGKWVFSSFVLLLPLSLLLRLQLRLLHLNFPKFSVFDAFDLLSFIHRNFRRTKFNDGFDSISLVYAFVAGVTTSTYFFTRWIVFVFFRSVFFNLFYSSFHVIVYPLFSFITALLYYKYVGLLLNVNYIRVLLTRARKICGVVSVWKMIWATWDLNNGQCGLAGRDTWEIN